MNEGGGATDNGHAAMNTNIQYSALEKPFFINAVFGDMYACYCKQCYIYVFTYIRPFLCVFYSMPFDLLVANER